MAQNYYPQLGGGAGPPAGGPPTGGPPMAGGPPSPAPEKEDEGGETALLPKSILAGKDFQPGEEVVLKVVHIYDDEVEVEYAPEKPETPASPEAMSADEEIEGMATMKGY